MTKIDQGQHTERPWRVQFDHHIEIAVVARRPACYAARDGERKHSPFAKNRFGSAQRAKDSVQQSVHVGISIPRASRLVGERAYLCRRFAAEEIPGEADVIAGRAFVSDCHAEDGLAV